MSIIASSILATALTTTNLAEQVAIMWTDHTNRVAMVEARRKSMAERRQSAVDRVKENAKNRKRRSAIGGVKK